jgi:hypothetical protein
MAKMLKAIQRLSIASSLAICLTTLMLMTTLFIPQQVYAADRIDRGAEKVIQPFELTKPAATRGEAYDDVAKLNKNPKELIAAENKEEKAQEDLVKKEQKIKKEHDSVLNKYK